MKTEHQAPRRTRRIELALHEDELRAIDAAAMAAGHTPAAWVRHVALKSAPPPPVTGAGAVIDQAVAETLAELARRAHDLARHGNLLNQLVTHLNLMVEGGQLRDPRTAADAVKRVGDSRTSILQMADQVRELRALLLARVTSQ